MTCRARQSLFGAEYARPNGPNLNTVSDAIEFAKYALTLYPDPPSLIYYCIAFLTVDLNESSPSIA